MKPYVVRDGFRGEQIGVVEAVTVRWWKGYCYLPGHDPVSADTHSKAAEELRRHYRAEHWGLNPAPRRADQHPGMGGLARPATAVHVGPPGRLPDGSAAVLEEGAANHPADSRN